MTAGRTTDEWAALLDGTTPGPWVWVDEPDDADIQYIVDWDTGGMCLSLGAIGSGSAYKPSDPVLAAVAPEAVAEVIRLRRAMEAVRDDYRRDVDADRELAHFSTVPLVPIFNDLADTLTRILEGDNNE